MRYILLSAAFALSLSACDWNNNHDYDPKAEYRAFLKKQEEAKKTAEAEAPKAEAPAEAAKSEGEAAPAEATPEAATSTPAAPAPSAEDAD